MSQPLKFLATVSIAISINALTAYAGISNGLIGYYDFETDITDKSASTITHNGTYQTSNPIADTGAAFSGDAIFPGDDPTTSTDRSNLLLGNALNIAGNSGLGASGTFYINSLNTDGNETGSLGNSFSISSWFFIAPDADTAPQRHFIFEPHSDFPESGDNYDISFGSSNIVSTTAEFSSYVGQSKAPESTNLATGTWHHVLQTFSSDGTTTTMDVFINGTKTTSHTAPTASISFNGINFGMHRAETGRALDGMLDEVAIWNRSLTNEEAATVYAHGLNAKPLVSNEPPVSTPIINSFTSSSSSTAPDVPFTLSWDVTNADTVTIIDDPLNVALTGSQNVSTSKPKTYTLVAFNGNSVASQQITINISGPTDPVGPLVGTVKTTEAYFLYRPGPDEINLRLTVLDESLNTIITSDTTSLAANDYVAKFHTTNLTPGTTYRYKIEKINPDNSTTLYAGNSPDHTFTTVPLTRTNQIFTATLVSCVNDTSDLVWAEMINQNPNLLILAGDTPYVDTGDLTSIRTKHRHLLQRDNLKNLIRNTPTIGTWDDHDFGLNGGNGVSTAGRKVNTRRGFVEYRAHDKYGDGSGNGVYHKADMGPIEFFMLDPRWFSQTSASPIDATQSTCFGTAQWVWLLNAIRTSKAPFKVLVQGQIWQDKKNGETDDMFTYWSERDALLNIIRDEKIPGVVLFGGDIHVARQLMHPRRVGYDLYDFIMSPGHKSVIESLNVYHPSLEWSRERQNQFLTMTADTTKSVPELTVRYMDQDGNENHKVTLTYDQLSYNEGPGLAKDLRGLWTFDGNLENTSVLGNRIHATAINGATLSPNGIKGGAVTFDRSNSQHLTIPRSFLDDNASTYTASAWVKASNLPEHGSSDRHFIMESYVNNHTGLSNASTSGFAISIGLVSSDTDPSKIKVQLFTETLDPKAVGSQQAPGFTTQGGFDYEVDRTIFTNWAHTAVTFDSTKLSLYINGSLANTDTLTIPAPIAETGGLIIGGHRAGTGRNWDGLIDEVAIWNRVLTNIEIASLYDNGTPPVIPAATAQIDTDDDALPDYWETIHGLTTTDPNDNTSDSDADGLNALQEFGFGSLPSSANQPPFTQKTISIDDQNYMAITYQRNPAAVEHMNQNIQRSTDLGTTDQWSDINTTIVEIITLPNGLQQVTERSTIPSGGQTQEFLRVHFSKK